tara:strand:- start:1011 stop:1424 length:414 start_codon:yes stop_codon:yes gene_type:complete
MSEMKYSWTVNYETKGSSVSESPCGKAPLMHLWMAVIDAQSTLDRIVEEEGDNLWTTPQVEIHRYADINGSMKYIDDLLLYAEWDGTDFSASEDGYDFEAWDDVVDWANEAWNTEEYEAYMAIYRPYAEKHIKPIMS